MSFKLIQASNAKIPTIRTTEVVYKLFLLSVYAVSIRRMRKCATDQQSRSSLPTAASSECSFQKTAAASHRSSRFPDCNQLGALSTRNTQATQQLNTQASRVSTLRHPFTSHCPVRLVASEGNSLAQKTSPSQDHRGLVVASTWDPEGKP